MPKVSIIIPVYNVAPYVEWCLQSVLEQTHHQLEIIVVNDASTDNSMDIARRVISRYNRPVRMIEHTLNKGLGAARNSGIDVATGEYIMFLDSDDWMDKDYIEQLAGVVATSPVDMLLAPIASYDNVSQTYYEQRYFIPKPLQGGGGQNPWLITDLDAYRTANPLGVYQMFPVVAFGKMYKREIFSAIRYPEGFIFEDEGFFRVMIWIIGSVGYYRPHQSYCYYRTKRKGSIINDFYAKGNRALDIIGIGDYIVTHTERLAKPYLPFAQSTKAHFLASYITRLYTIDKRSLHTMSAIHTLAATLQAFLKSLPEQTVKTFPDTSESRRKQFMQIRNTDLSVLDIIFLILRNHYQANRKWTSLSKMSICSMCQLMLDWVDRQMLISGHHRHSRWKRFLFSAYTLGFSAIRWAWRRRKISRLLRKGVSPPPPLKIKR